MTNEELRWLHRIEARIEIEGLQAGRRILRRLARFSRFIEEHQQMLARARQRFQELSVAERRAA